MKKSIMIITKTFLVWMIAMFTGSIAWAQPGGQGGPPPMPDEEHIENMIKDLDEELDLNKEQSEQISELYVAHFEKMEAKMKSGSRPEPSEMEALDADLEKKVKALLDKDQQKTYAAWLKEQKKNRPQGGPGGPRPSR